MRASNDSDVPLPEDNSVPPPEDNSTVFWDSYWFQGTSPNNFINPLDQEQEQEPTRTPLPKRPSGQVSGRYRKSLYSNGNNRDGNPDTEDFAKLPKISSAQLFSNNSKSTTTDGPSANERSFSISFLLSFFLSFFLSFL